MVSVEALQLLSIPFLACLVLIGIHCYLGIHVIERGVIFVDLALAQVAAVGIAYALLQGAEPESNTAFLYSLLFVFIGAAAFAVVRSREDRIPQEAIIGIAYVVASAGAILLLSGSPHGAEEMESILIGNILFVTLPDVLKTAAIYAVVGLFHYKYRDRFLLISQNVEEARRRGWSIVTWDFLFYLSFGLVVTRSVRIAGVLLVFSYFVVPTICAMLFARRIRTRLFWGWTIGFIGSVLGLYLSLKFDLPTGASVVVTFGAVLIFCAILYAFMQSRRLQKDPS